MRKLLPVAKLLLTAASKQQQVVIPAANAVINTHQGRELTSFVRSFLGYSFHTSCHTKQAEAPATTDLSAKEIEDASKRSYQNLLDKDVWDEAWAYENKVGSVEDPVVVPSVDAERIIGVTDPEDDTLVIWGIIKDGEPPKQLVEGGEFFVLKKVDYVVRVGDILDKLQVPK